MANNAGGPGRKKLVFHVGLPKTGTTTIQYYCLFNKQALAQDGIHVPSDISRHPTTPDGIPLGAPQLDGTSHFFDVGHQARKTLIDWQAEVERLGADDTLHTMLVSGENLFFRAYRAREGRLKARPANVDLASLVYLRHPIPFLNSLMLQLAVGLNLPWDKFYDAFLRHPVNYAEVGYLHYLDQLARISQLTALSFEEARRTDTLLQSFFDGLGASHDIRPFPHDTNVKSFGHHTGVLFTALRAVRPDAMAEEMNGVIGPLSYHCALNDTSGKYFIDEALHERIIERWKTERAVIEDRFGVSLADETTDAFAVEKFQIPSVFAEDILETMTLTLDAAQLDWLKRAIAFALTGFRLEDSRAVGLAA